MNFKKLIAGSTLALSLLGAYDVAKEMTQPNTMEAQAATAYWNKDKAKQLDQFMQRWQREIERLQYLQQINPNVRESEIKQLMRLQQQGLEALSQLALVPDSIRVLVAVKPH